MATNKGLEQLQKLYNNMNITCDRPLLATKCFVGLPTEFELTAYHIGNNLIIKNEPDDKEIIYSFKGIQGNRIIMGNHMIPDSLINDIPFSFPIVCDNITEIIQSNIYYYEVTIMDIININNMWPSECVSIGFATNDNPINSHVGWFANSIGYHSDDGTVRYNNNKGAPIVSRACTTNDTMGAGMIYMNKNIVKYFFTLNGKVIYTSSIPIIMSKPYFPAIGYDHSHSIKVNFSTSEFKFNLKNFIVENNSNIINMNESLEKTKFFSDKSNTNFFNSSNINDFYVAENLIDINTIIKIHGSMHFESPYNFNIYNNPSGNSYNGPTGSTYYNDPSSNMYGSTGSTYYNDPSSNMYGSTGNAYYNDPSSNMYGSTGSTYYNNSSSNMYGSTGSTYYNNSSSNMYGSTGGAYYNNPSSNMYGSTGGAYYNNPSSNMYGSTGSTYYNDPSGNSWNL